MRTWTEHDLWPEPPAGFDPRTLPQDLSRLELKRLMDWASGRLVMLDQKRPEEPELMGDPAVVTFVRKYDHGFHRCVALRVDGQWALTGMTRSMTWSQLLDWIESGSTPDHDAMATLRIMDARSSAL